ncbi:hypothetical protein IJD44_09025 [bacterium]|nr:hypothetical protein [bacterium]
MGLAASQARFLGLTARKSNVEYEGQQVNQQRMALAEEVNSLYNKLLSLNVPVAPEATEYYSTTYTFEVTGTENLDGGYTITNYYKQDSGYHVEGTRTYSKEGATGKWVDGSTIAMEEIKDEEENVIGSKYTYKPIGSEDSIELTLASDSTSAKIKEYMQEEGAYKNVSAEDIQNDNLYYYKDAKTGVTYYFSQYQMDHKNDEVNPTNVYYYTIGNVTKTEPFEFNNATMGFDETTGRINSITPNNGEFAQKDVNATKTYDSAGYEAALVDYTMSKDEYNKAVADLNAQTESLQQEDKVLELRLNQIETEQNEISTEIEAVKEVLSKNIENTFKTFA